MERFNPGVVEPRLRELIGWYSVTFYYELLFLAQRYIYKPENLLYFLHSLFQLANLSDPASHRIVFKNMLKSFWQTH